MPSLTLNGKTFSVDELKNWAIDECSTDFEETTLRFCKAWLSGQQEFRINTSGSTGAPKEIVLKREAMEQSARMTINALQLKSTDTALICLDTKYVAGQMVLVRSLIHGMNMVAVEPTVNPFSALKQQIDFTALVPYQLESILDHSPKILDHVRCAIIGGAALSHTLQEKAKKSRCAIYATYGMTETISHIALQKLNGAGAQDHFVTLEGVHIRLDDRGCLCIRANHLNSEIVTNDLVELIDDKKFKWLGRIDNVINSGGVKIIPEKVEAVIEKIFGSMQLKTRFFVTGLVDKNFGQRVVLVCEGATLSETLQSQVSERAKQLLSKYEAPKEFVFVSKFAETGSGKVNRQASLN
jgi:O-succinylbenzoic acid--CoA ligase